MRSVAAVSVAVLLAAARPAEASDFGGLWSGLLTFTLALPLAVASLILMGLLGAAGAYRSRRLALWHAGLASIAPAVAAAATLIDSRAIDDAGVRLLVNGILLALAQLPLFVHARQVRS
jgi:hypothetical protein